MSRIDLNIVATGQFGQVETALSRLRAQVAALNTQMAGIGGVDPATIRSVQSYVNSFNEVIDRSGMFDRHMVNMTTETERFGRSLQQNRLRLSEYSRAIREFRRGEMGQIKQLAREQVRMMNATSMMMPDGRAQVIVPRGIDEAIDKQKILNQEYRIFRQTVQGASTQLINWGKNTQWAGRQLTVGLTVPLTIFGAAAGKMFMDVDKELTRLGKVYGGTAGKIASPTQVAAIREQTQALAKELAASMGIAAQETAGLAADIAATGAEGADLIAATRESVRLSVLGEVDRQEAMRATLAIQSVFKKSNEELADSINFLNSVENQTSTTLNDLVTGIVKAGPVVEGLGGSIQDLAMMMVAMREGGVPAAEAANAIKSSMGSLINPTKVTSEQFKEMGINLRGLVDKNAGDLIGTLKALQDELSTLDELSRQRAIEQLFGKYQFARINALLDNLGRAGSQTEEVTKLAALSAEQLAKTAENELKVLTESASMRFQRALETIKANLIPIGETFVNIGTVLLEIGNRVFEIFNSLPQPVQNFIKGLGLFVGLAGPIIMITGVMGNFLGYIVKGAGAMLALKRAGRGAFEYFTPESVAARTASELLTGAVYNQTEAFGVMNAALETLNQNLKEMSMNLRNAQNASTGMAGAAMAAAEGSAVVSGGRIDPESITGTMYYDEHSKYRGFERSHNIPVLTGMERDYQTSAIILPDYMTAERSFQSASKTWTPQFYDPSSGMTRREFLAQNADTAAARNLISNPKSAFTDEGLARLAPTREEYKQSATAYLAGLKTLVNNTNKETMDALKSAKARGDFAGMRAIIERAISENKIAYQGYVNEISTSLDASGQTMEQMTKAAMGLESQISPKSGMFATIKEGRGFNAYLYSLMGGGIADVNNQMMAAAQALINPVGSQASQFISQARAAGMKLAGYTSAKGKKYIVDFTNGIEQATVYAVNSSTGQIEKVIKGAVAKKMASSPQAQAAIARHDSAVARLDAMTKADIDSATAALNAASGQNTPGVPAPGRQPGRFSRFMGGAGGMGLMGGMSALSMLGGATQGNAAMSILGTTGMGASLGMMAGPKGAAAGAAIGALAGTFMSAKSNMDEVRANAKKLADSMSLSASALDQTAEFFGNTTMVSRASAESVLEGTGIRQKQLTQGQEYLASEAGQKFVEGFSQGINSYGFNTALDGMARNLATMVMQGALSFEDAEGISAAMAEQLNMPTLTAKVQGELTSILGPDGRDVLKRPITVALEIQEENMRQAAQMQAAVLSQEIGDIQPTITQSILTGILGPTGIALQEIGNMDIPGLSGWVRDLRGFVNQDYSTAVAGVTALGKTIGNQLRTAYDNINVAKQRYNDLEKEALAMEKGPERKRALAELDREKRKIGELEQSYEEMRKQSSEYFGDILAQDAGLAAEYLGSMSESVKEMFAGTAEDPAAQALIGLLSGMDQQLQADVMLNISSGQMSPTAAMSFINMLGGGEDAVKAFNIVVESQGITGANEMLLKLMQIEDEELRKTLILQLVAESGGEDYAMGMTDEEKATLESDLEDLKQKRDDLLNRKEKGTLFSAVKPDFYDDDIADVEADIASIEQRLADAEARANQVASETDGGYTMPVDSARYAAQIPGADVKDIIAPSLKTVTDYNLALQELDKLNVAPDVDLSQVDGMTQETLSNVTSILQEILALPDDIVKSIDVNAVSAMGDLSRFEVNWKKVDSFQDIEKQLGMADNFSDTFNKFGINYSEFAALPNIVKYMIMYYVELLMKINAQITALAGTAATEGPEAGNRAIEGLRTQAATIMDTVKGIISSAQGSGYTPSTTTSPPSTTSGGDGGSGGGGKDKNPYEDLIKQQNKLIDGIRREREERQRVLRLQEESLNFMLKQQGLQNQIARARAEGNLAEAALLQAQKDIDAQQRERELEEERRQQAEDREIRKREQIIEILEKGGKFAEKLAAAIKRLDGAIPYSLLDGRGGKGKGKGKGKAFGGMISGPGGPRDDLIPVMLSNGEFVVQASAVDKYGVGFMQMINNKQLDGFAGGGYSSRYPGMVAKMAIGGQVMRASGSALLANNNTEYNIEVNVAGTNASPDDIATEVIRAIERRQRMKGTMIRI
jgi:TP901 family phage tail tape measure protein